MSELAALLSAPPPPHTHTARAWLLTTYALRTHTGRQHKKLNRIQRLELLSAANGRVMPSTSDVRLPQLSCFGFPASLFAHN